MSEKTPNFLKNEKIITETKPASFLTYFLSQAGELIILLGLVFIFLIGISNSTGFLLSFSLIFLTLILLLFITIYYALKYRWEYYWITNLRIIQRKGLIGYHFYSTPYERMSDVILSRSWIERILGVGSVRVQTLAGSITYGGPFGAELRMIALADPEEVQKIAWQFLKKKPTGL